MFNLGFWEMVVLAGIALIVVGPERLPGLARKIGSFVTDLKRTTNTIAADITDAIDEEKFLNTDESQNLKSTDKLDNLEKGSSDEPS